MQTQPTSPAPAFVRPTTASELVVERREQEDTGVIPVSDSVAISITPAIDESYWNYRVRLTEEQAVVGFPKHGTVGIRFAREENWNTNLPYTEDAQTIADHIICNRGDRSITDELVLDAIKLLRYEIIQDIGRQVVAALATNRIEAHIDPVTLALVVPSPRHVRWLGERFGLRLP
jgi:hypothetical protein